MTGNKWSQMGKGFNLDSIIEANAKEEPQSVPAIVFPTVSTAEDAEKIVLRMEVPGFREEDLHVRMVGDALQVRGEVETENGGDGETRRRRDLFVRSFVLPESVDGSRVRRTYEAGVLTLVLPKSEDDGRSEAAA